MDKMSEERKEHIKRFKRFLKEENVYPQYRRNLLNSKHKYVIFNLKYKHDVYSFFCESSIEGLINHAFCWAETKEGHDFWNKLNIKWHYYIEQNEI